MVKADKVKRRESQKRKESRQRRPASPASPPARTAKRSVNVAVCVPIGWNGYIHDLTAAWCEVMGRKGAHRLSYQSPCPETGRNQAIDTILYRMPNITHVFCLDSDVVPPVDAISRLLAHDKDIVGGVYPFWKNKRPAWSIYHDEGSIYYYDELPSKLFKINAVQGGMTLIKMSVFEKIKFPYYQDRIDEISRTHDRVEYKKTSEDGYLCQKAAAAGIECWCDPTVRGKHFKTVDLLEVFDNMQKS